MKETFRAFRIEEVSGGFVGAVASQRLEDLPDNEVTVRVAYSSLNFKDALSATGNRGVTKRYPHTPGIDAAGTVAASRDARFREGDEVIVTGFDLGMNTPGGFGEFIRVPAEWLLPLPPGLELREAMALGTAGLTAGLCVDALQRAVHPADGPVVVTGASGGVGSIAVALLAQLDFEVIASTGSESAGESLLALGARRILERGELSAASDRPLLSSVYAGAVDTVGGRTLTNLVKSLSWGGAVAACGLVGGADLELTVYPFILRGVSLLGIDSVQCPMARRQLIWRRLAGPWKPKGFLARLVTEIGLDELDRAITDILAGRTVGRLLVRVNG